MAKRFESGGERGVYETPGGKEGWPHALSPEGKGGFMKHPKGKGDGLTLSLEGNLMHQAISVISTQLQFSDIDSDSSIRKCTFWSPNENENLKILKLLIFFPFC